jgi:futalosine hydrolase
MQICIMKILIVAAMELEIAPFEKLVNNKELGGPDDHIEILYTGVGIMEATYALASRLSTRKPDLAIQAGIGGSFHSIHPPGSIFAILDDAVGDMGVVEGGSLKNIVDMGFASPDKFPYSGGLLHNKYPDLLEMSGLKAVKGITVNEITTDPKKNQLIAEKYTPVIESMEGAPFHYVCLEKGVPFLQIRSVSNFVGERDMKNWDLVGAVRILNDTLTQLVQIFTDTPTS